MAVKKMRVGIIGCGKVACVLHMHEYSLNPEADVVAVCDNDPGRLKIAADRYGIRKR